MDIQRNWSFVRAALVMWFWISEFLWSSWHIFIGKCVGNLVFGKGIVSTCSTSRSLGTDYEMGQRDPLMGVEEMNPGI